MKFNKHFIEHFFVDKPLHFLIFEIYFLQCDRVGKGRLKVTLASRKVWLYSRTNEGISPSRWSLAQYIKISIKPTPLHLLFKSSPCGDATKLDRFCVASVATPCARTLADALPAQHVPMRC